MANYLIYTEREWNVKGVKTECIVLFNANTEELKETIQTLHLREPKVEKFKSLEEYQRILRYLQKDQTHRYQKHKKNLVSYNPFEKLQQWKNQQPI